MISARPRPAGRLAVLAVVALAPGCRTPQRPAAPAETFAASKTLSITVLDVGTGEAALVRSPRGDTLLIDGGPPGATSAVLFETLRRHHALHPDHVVVSHLSPGTVGGLVMLLAGRDHLPGTKDDVVPPGVLLDYGPDYACTTLECLGYAHLAHGHVTVARPGDTIDLGDGVTARVVAVNGRVVGGGHVDVKTTGARSIALLVRYGAFTYLTAGGLTGGGGGTADVETPLARAVGHVDVLRVFAHGADTSTRAESLARLSPRVAIVSPGGPAGCTPSGGVLARLVGAGARVLLTETPRRGPHCPALSIPAPVRVVNGPIRIDTDGRRYVVVPLTLGGRPAGGSFEGEAGNRTGARSSVP